MIIPGLFELPVRTLRAAIPENKSVSSKRSIMSTLTNVRPVTWPVVLVSPVCGFCLAALATMEADLPEMTGWFDPDILEAQ